MKLLPRSPGHSPIIDSLPKLEAGGTSPDHLLPLGEERRIPVITVIERWALCHHLGCVVRYLAGPNKKPALLKDLKTAEWYLERELTQPQYCSTGSIGAQTFTMEALLEDWNLSFHLGEALYHIKASKSPSMREESLKYALKHLKAEISTHEHGLVKTSAPSPNPVPTRTTTQGGTNE